MEVLNMDVVNVVDERIVGMFGAITILLFVVFLMTSRYETVSAICAFLTLTSLGFLLLSMVTCRQIKRQYEVILNDDYSAKELYEKYDVIEQRGEIWVIREKETETDE